MKVTEPFADLSGLLNSADPQEPDEFLIRELRTGAFTLAGTWKQTDTLKVLAPVGERREIRLSPDERRFLGVAWWSIRYDYTAVVTEFDPENGEMSFSITSPIATVYAERWRRIGHALVKYLPSRQPRLIEQE